jgi:outer membrane protein assembly factor BamB
MTEVVYLHKLLEREASPALFDWFTEAGHRLLGVSDEIEQTYGKGFTLARPESLRQLWYTAENIHSERVLWSVPLGLYVAATPAVADLTGDGHLETVAVSSHKEITAISHDGKLLWTVMTRGERYEYPHFSSPLILSGEREGCARILTGAADGALYCLAEDGRRLWEHQTGNRIDAAPAAADIDGDGHIEILVASRDGTLTCLGEAGERRWTVDFGEPIFATPAIAPTNEVIVSTLEGTVACVTARGEVRWRQMLVVPATERRAYHGVPSGKLYALSESGPGAIYASPLITDLDGDGKIDIVIGVSTGRVLVYDMHGSLQWEAATAGAIYSSPCAIGRGKESVLVIVGSDDGNVHAIDVAGSTVWQFETGGPIRSSPVVVPERVAGTESIVVGSSDHRVYVIDRGGHELEEYLAGDEIFGAPLVADVNGDGLAEIIVSCYDHRVYAFRTGWKVMPGEIVVGMFRSGPMRQGA